MALDESLLDELLADADPDQLLYELEKTEAEESLSEFTKQAWHIIEPGSPYIFMDGTSTSFRNTWKPFQTASSWKTARRTTGC